MTLSSHALVAAAGSVTGRDHRRAERDGQDGCAVVRRDDLAAVVVTDGCSSGGASEVGARVGAAWLATLVERYFGRARTADAAQDATSVAVDVTRDLLDRLRLLARSFDAEGEIDPARVEQYLLFSFLVAVFTPSIALVFGIGDGVVLVDDEVTVLDPGPRNAPPYVAYGLLGETPAPRLHFLGRAADVGVLGVATDGLAGEPAGSLVELATDARYAKNPSLLRKRLVVLADRGRFSDDATIAVLQRGAR